MAGADDVQKAETADRDPAENAKKQNSWHI